jgi:hypothetical protein
VGAWLEVVLMPEMLPLLVVRPFFALHVILPVYGSAAATCHYYKQH